MKTPRAYAAQLMEPFIPRLPPRPYDDLLEAAVDEFREAIAESRRAAEEEIARLREGLYEASASLIVHGSQLAHLEAALRRIAGDTQHEAREGDDEDAEAICGLCAMGIDDHDPGCLIGIAKEALR
jgi:hypothetical protein